MMCVNWGLGQSISVQTYSYVGAGNDLFTEIFPEGQVENCIRLSRKPASGVPTYGGMELQKSKQHRKPQGEEVNGG